MDNLNQSLLQVEDLMSLLNVGKNSVYRLLEAGEIKGFKIGRVWKIPQFSLNEYIEKQTQNYMSSNLQKGLLKSQV